MTPTATATTATAPAPGVAAGPAGAHPKTGTVEIRCPDGGWLAVCGPDDLTPGRGVAALLPDGSQAALFLDRAGRIHAIGNRDPFSGAYVLSRGIVGSAGATATVASPVFKQVFDLGTGRCLSDPQVAVPVHDVRRRGDAVEIRLRGGG